MAAVTIIERTSASDLDDAIAEWIEEMDGGLEGDTIIDSIQYQVIGESGWGAYSVLIVWHCKSDS